MDLRAEWVKMRPAVLVSPMVVPGWLPAAPTITDLPGNVPEMAAEGTQYLGLCLQCGRLRVPIFNHIPQCGHLTSEWVNWRSLCVSLCIANRFLPESILLLKAWEMITSHSRSSRGRRMRVKSVGIEFRSVMLGLKWLWTGSLLNWSILYTHSMLPFLKLQM